MRQMHQLRLFLTGGLMSAGAIIWAGCGSQHAEGPSAADRALADPFNYGPKAVAPDTRRTDDSKLDRDGLKRDLDYVLNP